MAGQDSPTISGARVGHHTRHSSARARSTRRRTGAAFSCRCRHESEMMIFIERAALRGRRTPSSPPTRPRRLYVEGRPWGRNLRQQPTRTRADALSRYHSSGLPRLFKHCALPVWLTSLLALLLLAIDEDAREKDDAVRDDAGQHLSQRLTLDLIGHRCGFHLYR